MAELHKPGNVSVPAQRDHDQWRRVPYSFQPPYHDSTGLSQHDQTTCAPSPCVPGPKNHYAPLQDRNGVSTGFRWDTNCRLSHSRC